MSRLETEWQEYQEENPDETYTTMDCFNFHNKKMQEWYDESDSGAKDQVEEFWLKYKEGLLEGDDDANQNLLLQR